MCECLCVFHEVIIWHLNKACETENHKNHIAMAEEEEGGEMAEVNGRDIENVASKRANQRDRE